MSLDVSVGPATRDEIAQFYEGTAEYTVMRVNGKAIGMATVGRVDDCIWVMLQLREGADAHVVRIVRALRDNLRRRNATVYSVCGGAPDFPQSERLHSLCGFVPTGELIAGKRVWRWSPQKQTSEVA